MAHYTITPLEKKSIYIVYEMYRENADGSISWFNVEDHYRWGRGFIAEDMECNLSAADSPTQYCKAEDGEYDGCDLEDQVACWFEFSDDITEDEQEEIKKNYLEGNEDGYMGAGWLYDDPDHNWQEEDCYVVVLGPYKVEFCDEQGEVIREVKLLTNDEWLKAYEKAGSYVSKDSALNNV